MAEADMKRIVRDAIAGNSFCTLATSSAENRPHVAGVLYEAVEGVLYVSTFDNSIKTRNIRQNRRVAVCIPVQQYPGAPPSCAQFQGTAEVCGVQDPRIAALLAAGRLATIGGHGVLDHPDSRFVRITPGRRIATYGLGVPLEELMRDPTAASRSVDLS